MTTYSEVKLRNMITDLGKVELTVVPNNGSKPFDEVHTDFQEAKAAILFYENDHQIYF